MGYSGILLISSYKTQNLESSQVLVVDARCYNVRTITSAKELDAQTLAVVWRWLELARSLAATAGQDTFSHSLTDSTIYTYYCLS